MRRVLVLACVIAACESPEARLPSDQPGRQRVLSEQVLRDAVALAPTDGDSARIALAQVRVPAHSPRLRMLVSGDQKDLARGAAEALVSIRLRREGYAPTALLQCVTEETNEFVRSACFTRQMAKRGPLEMEALVDGLTSRSDEERRTALQALLDRPEESWPAHPRLDGAVVHLLDAKDPAVRLLAGAAFLRRSIAVAPPPLDAAEMGAR